MKKEKMDRNAYEIFPYILSIKNISERELEKFIDMVPYERKHKAERYAFFEDKKRCIMGYCLVKYALNKEYGLKGNLLWTYEKYGKPRLSDISDIHFNISHSGDWIAVCVGTIPMGVDIEKVRDNIHIVNKVFSQTEVETINSMTNGNAIDYFIKQWTIKEAYTKYLGKGINKDFSEIYASSMNMGIRNSLIIFDKNLLVGIGGVQEKIKDRYWLTVVSRCAPNMVYKVIEISHYRLYDKLEIR